jgi:DNA invertase Pin-like site-specific DNA recombinase
MAGRGDNLDDSTNGSETSMLAAIYARKSTDQNIADEEKSVRRQVEQARAYAARKGWTVDEAHTYTDDAISGAEFVKRPGFLRLMNALTPRAPFQALVMMEESRLGREQIETAYALKQIMDADVRVFFYLEDRERTLDSAMDKVMLSLTTFAAEMEREKARQRTYDAMARKARAQHVTGGKVYGYDNVEIRDASGQRLHVVRRINPDQAAVIRRLFDGCAGGLGLTRLAKALNADGVRPPRKASGWAPTAIREILHRPLYRGELIWNQRQKIMRRAPRPSVGGHRRSGSAWMRRICASSRTSSGRRRTPSSRATGLSTPGQPTAACSAARATSTSRGTRRICSQESRGAPSAAAPWWPSRGTRRRHRADASTVAPTTTSADRPCAGTGSSSSNASSTRPSSTRSARSWTSGWSAGPSSAPW